MTSILNNKFARLIWKDRLWSAKTPLKTTDGALVTITEMGKVSQNSDDIVGASLVIGGLMCNGVITFADSGVLCSDDTIVQILVAPADMLCHEDGNLIPQVILPVDEQLKTLFLGLLNLNRYYTCGKFIASMDSCQRLTTITRLLVERLQDKHEELMEIHHSVGEDWNSTLYVSMFRAMGLPDNKEPYTALARIVPYDVVSREKGYPEHVEALLFGGSGLLQSMQEQTPYIQKLREDFEYLQSKYGIKPFRSGEWKLNGSNPYGSVNLKLSQLAGFLCTAEFIFNNLIACRTVKDVYKLFHAEATEYWSQKASEKGKIRKMGDERKQILGINFVVPLMFAYGRAMLEESLCESAVELLEKMPAENNSITRGWHAGGVPFRNAFDSQAMIQLYKKYCVEQRCCECPFGKVQINNKFNTILK